eukprot:4961178-Amphidinium_carterae.1
MVVDSLSLASGRWVGPAWTQLLLASASRGGILRPSTSKRKFKRCRREEPSQRPSAATSSGSRTRQADLFGLIHGRNPPPLGTTPYHSNTFRGFLGDILVITLVFEIAKSSGNTIDNSITLQKKHCNATSRQASASSTTKINKCSTQRHDGTSFRSPFLQKTVK